VKRPQKDLNTVRREVSFYSSLGGKSYRVKNSEYVVHFLHLKQIEDYFQKTGHMPILENTKWDLFLINSYYDLYNPDTGTQREATVEEALDIYISDYLNSGFIEENGLIDPENF